MATNKSPAPADKQADNQPKLSPIKLKTGPAPTQPVQLQPEPVAKTLDAPSFDDIPACPVFKPSLKEFTTKTFSQILIDCESKAGDSAIFKVRRAQTDQHRSSPLTAGNHAKKATMRPSSP